MSQYSRHSSMHICRFYVQFGLPASPGPVQLWRHAAFSSRLCRSVAMSSTQSSRSSTRARVRLFANLSRFAIEFHQAGHLIIVRNVADPALQAKNTLLIRTCPAGVQVHIVCASLHQSSMYSTRRRSVELLERGHSACRVKWASISRPNLSHQ